MPLPRHKIPPDSPPRPHGHCRYYSPRLGRQLVCALYHEARRRQQPMTRLADKLLASALRGTAGLRIAEEQFPTPAGSPRAG